MRKQGERFVIVEQNIIFRNNSEYNHPSLMVIILIPFAYANASPAEAELILENIKIEPLYPKIGESVTVTGEVYNAGKISTNSLASIITTAYFVDGKLLHIDDLGNVEPGIRNKIKILSGPIWKAETGKQTIKIVIDYRNTLKDQYDFPDDKLKIKVKIKDALKSLGCIIKNVYRKKISSKL